MGAQSTLAKPARADDEFSPIHLAPVTDWTAMRASEHFVQFYEEDSYLERSVAGFLSAGLRQGETAILIATPGHRKEIEAQLREEGLEPDAARAGGTYVPLDAADTLARFMIEGMPDGRLFNHVIGNLVAQASRKGQLVRAFGEMVALLWQAGNAEAAIHLEELWNELGQAYCFSLFCAYPIAAFHAEANGKPFTHICKAHDRVIPAESYNRGSTADERLRTITSLQQKAASLESEITKRKQIEKELFEEQRELLDFLQNAAEGIHQVDEEGKILWANKAELDLLGYTADEYIGHNIREFHADPEVIADILQRLSRREELRDCGARLKHKDGSFRDVCISSNVYWSGDQFRYTRCFTRDITERKRAAETLEMIVAQRTAQLRETVGELEAFSYSISHDMRAPLRAMQGYARLILDEHGTALPEEAVTYLERIQRSASRLDLLVRDVLAYSRVSKGPVRCEPVALGPLMEDLIEQLPEIQPFRSRIRIVQPLHTVRGHEGYLIQCFTNLIENGIKFVEPEHAPEIWVSSELVGTNVRVWVCDNGIGIAPQHRSRLFQIFGRVHHEKKYPGTGIGLAIVKKAVERMGGEVGFHSDLGKGSRFWFTLPAVSDGQ